MATSLARLNKTMVPDLCAVILAGGKSRRMGFNKALLQIDGLPLIMRISGLAKSLTDEVLISSDDSGSYAFLGFPTVCDIFPDQGPLAGLQAAMHQSLRSLFLLVACDMPNLREPLLHALISSAGHFDAVIPCTADGRRHPLCAVYRKTCLSAIEHNLQRRTNKVTDIFIESQLSVRWLTGAEGGFDDADLTNLNTPEDLASFLSG